KSKRKPLLPAKAGARLGREPATVWLLLHAASSNAAGWRRNVRATHADAARSAEGGASRRARADRREAGGECERYGGADRTRGPAREQQPARRRRLRIQKGTAAVARRGLDLQPAFRAGGSAQGGRACDPERGENLRFDRG